MKHRSKILIELFKRRNFDELVNFEGKAHDKQREALFILTDNQTKEFAFGGGAGGAKSWTGCQWLMFSALAYEETRYFIGREELKRLRESTLLTFYKVAKTYGIEKGIDFTYNGSDHYILFANGSRIDLLDLKYLPSDELYERYGSVEYTSGFIEEAGEVNFNAFDTLKTRINRYNNSNYDLLGKIFITLNPKKNWVKSEFYDKYKKGNLPAYRKFLPSLVTDNPFIDSEHIENLKNISDKIKKERLLFGNFDYDDDKNCLINGNKIDDLFTNTFADPGEKIMSCDIALLNDKFVVVVWDGFIITHIYIFDKIPSNELPNKLEELANIHTVPRSNIIYDADGIGGYLRGYLPGAIAFNNNHRAGSPEYPNLKTHLYYKLAQLINENKIWIKATLTEETKSNLIEELQMVKTKESNNERYCLMSKADVKGFIGRSPDISDAFMFRMYYYLAKHF